MRGSSPNRLERETVPTIFSLPEPVKVVARRYAVCPRIHIDRHSGRNFGGVVRAAPARQTDPPPPCRTGRPPSIIGEPGGLITLNGGASTGNIITFNGGKYPA